MIPTFDKTEKESPFFQNLPAEFSYDDENPAEQRLLAEYGAVFVTRGGAVPPKKVVFKDEADVTPFQSLLPKMSAEIGGFTMELQTPAMNALIAAIDEANGNGLSITPRDTDSSRRSYNETVSLWASRVDPALVHWVGQGKITEDDAIRIQALSPFEQLPEVFFLEEKEIWFAKDLSKSIIYSVAPPGASQHLSMLAFDISEHEDLQVRKVLAKHGWFQTVVSDLPHFTFLGVAENELIGLGLKKVTNGGREFWIPDI